MCKIITILYVFIFQGTFNIRSMECSIFRNGRVPRFLLPPKPDARRRGDELRGRGVKPGFGMWTTHIEFNFLACIFITESGNRWDWYRVHFLLWKGPLTKHQKLSMVRQASTFSFDDLSKLNICKMTYYRKRTPSERELIAKKLRHSSLGKRKPRRAIRRRAISKGPGPERLGSVANTSVGSPRVVSTAGKPFICLLIKSNPIIWHKLIYTTLWRYPLDVLQAVYVVSPFAE